MDNINNHSSCIMSLSMSSTRFQPSSIPRVIILTATFKSNETLAPIRCYDNKTNIRKKRQIWILIRHKTYHKYLYDTRDISQIAMILLIQSTTTPICPLPIHLRWCHITSFILDSLHQYVVGLIPMWSRPITKDFVQVYYQFLVYGHYQIYSPSPEALYWWLNVSMIVMDWLILKDWKIWYAWV